MSGPPVEKTDEFTLEAELEEGPEMVWRALSETALREVWLGETGEVIECIPPEQLTLRCDDEAASGLVTFTVRPARDGGSRLTIVHRRQVAVKTLTTSRTSTLAWKMAA